MPRPWMPAAAADAVHEAIADQADLLSNSARARGRHANLSFFAFTATPRPRPSNRTEPRSMGRTATVTR